MYELLVTDYAREIRDTTKIADRQCYADDEYVYFTICAEDKEAIYMEQAALAYFLKEEGCGGAAWPIRNEDGGWITSYQNKPYLVFCAEVRDYDDAERYGELLAHFHKRFSHYPYEPKYVSAYGKWRSLWIEKLEYYEANLERMARQKHHPYCHQLVDLFTYVIGLSENAIHYIRECENETRYGESDQATITFQRCSNQLLKPIIWPDELMYDHPARDLAEWIRPKLLDGRNQSTAAIQEFLEDYESVQPLSYFAWRLLYGRLLFPAHLFDQLEELFLAEGEEEQEKCLVSLEKISWQQARYEKRLGSFFEMNGLDPKTYDIPVLDWL